MPDAFQSLVITNRLACEGAPTVFAVIPAHELVSAHDARAVEEQESMSFQVSRMDAHGTERDAIALMRPGRIARVVWNDGSFDEWRIATVSSGRGENGLFTVTCVALWLDLVERATGAGAGWVSDLIAGERNFEYELVERTPANILATYCIPNGPPWLALGTVTPTNVIHALTVSRMTPGAVAVAVRDALRDMDVPCELSLRRNGVTNYLLDLVTEVGAGAPTPVLTPTNALLALKVVSDATLQATRVLVKGNMSPDAAPGVWGIARWRVTSAAAPVFTLADRAGGASPIAFDGQYVGMCLLRCKTGTTIQISASNAAAGTVTLFGIRGAASTIAVGELVEFRHNETFINTRRITVPTAGPSALNGNVLPFGVTAVTATTMTISDRFYPLTLSPGDAVATDNQFADWIIRRLQFIVASTDCTSFYTPLGVLTAAGLTTTAGVQVGDVMFFCGGPAANGGAFYGFPTGNQMAFIVDAVRATEVDVHVRPGDPGIVSMSGSIGGQLIQPRFYRTDPTHKLIISSVAATNVLTHDGAGACVVGDAIEIIQTRGASEVPSYVDHPTHIQSDPAGYGLKAAELTRAQAGVSQIGVNAWQRTWTVPTAAPDGWVIGGTGSPVFSRNTTPAFTRYGGASLRCQGGNSQVNAPTCYPEWDPGHTRLSARAFVYINVLTDRLRFAVWAAHPNGLPDTQLGVMHAVSVTCDPTYGTSYTVPVVAAKAWVELKVEGLVRDFYNAPYGIVATVDGAGGADYYVDAIEVYPHMTCPSDAFEFGDVGQLLQSGNQHLRQYATPPLSYTFQVRDLARIFPQEFARLAITLGANVRAADVEEGNDVTVRTLKMDRDLLSGADTQLTLANRPTLITNLQGEGAATQADIIAAIQSGQLGGGEGPQFTPVTAALTLSPKAEIVTPNANYVITLAQDSAVTYTTTTPGLTASITQGTPPSRERSLFAL